MKEKPKKEGTSGGIAYATRNRDGSTTYYNTEGEVLYTDPSREAIADLNPDGSVTLHNTKSEEVWTVPSSEVSRILKVKELYTDLSGEVSVTPSNNKDDSVAGSSLSVPETPAIGTTGDDSVEVPTKEKEPEKTTHTVEDSIYVEKENGEFECTVSTRTTDDPEVAKHWIPTVFYKYKDGRLVDFRQGGSSKVYSKDGSVTTYNTYIKDGMWQTSSTKSTDVFVSVVGDHAHVDEAVSSVALKVPSIEGISS